MSQLSIAPTKVNYLRNHPKRILINFLGGSCSGKSTKASELFSCLKRNALNSYLIQEYVTRFWVNEGRTVNPYDQLFFSATVAREEYLCLQNYKIVVTDSPAFLCWLYAEMRQNSQAGMLESRSVRTVVQNHWESLEASNTIVVNVYMQFDPSLFDSENRYEKDIDAVQAVDFALKNLLAENTRLGYGRFTSLSFVAGITTHPYDILEAIYNKLRDLED